MHIQVPVSYQESSSLSQIMCAVKTSLSETEKDVLPAAPKLAAPASAALAKCISGTDVSAPPHACAAGRLAVLSGVLAAGPDGYATVT